MKRDHVIIVGGGFAGLLAAKIASSQFDRVTIIEKDPNNGDQKVRAGAVQGAHLHVLLQRGQEILKRIFPDFEREFEKAGCPKIDWAADTLWKTFSGRFPRYPSSVITYSMSRPFLESLLFTQVKGIQNVEFISGLVTEIVQRDSNSVIVKLNDRNLIVSNLVVVAGGRNFPLERVLALPIEIPVRTYPIEITYRTMEFDRPSLAFNGYKQYYYQFSPPHDSLGAVIGPMEGNRVFATIIEHRSPNVGRIDKAQFLDLAKKIPCSDFYEIVKNGLAVSKVAVLTKPSMFHRCLNKVKSFPQNIFVMGDTLCSLNPVFGQGMTVVLEQSLILRSILKDHRPQSFEFHRRCARKIALPFFLSQFGSTVEFGFPLRALRFLLRCCQSWPRLHRKFLNVLHLNVLGGFE